MHTWYRKIWPLLTLVFLMPDILLSQINPVIEWNAPSVANTNWAFTNNWLPNANPNNRRLEWKGLGTTASNNNQGPSAVYKRLYFSGTKAYTITGNQITLIDAGGGGFGWIQSAATANQIINLTGTETKVRFNDNKRTAVISTSNTGTLSVNNIELGLNLTALKFFGELTSGSMSITGGIWGNKPIIIGSSQVNDLKTNTRVFFSGNNSNFSGPIHIESGSLNLRNSSSDGISASNFITVNNNGALSLGATSLPAGPPVTLSGKKIIINGTGINSAGALRNSFGTVTVLSDILLGNNSTITSGGGTLNLTHIGKFEGALDWDITFAGTGAINILSSGSIGAINGFATIGNLVKREAGLLTISAPCYFTGGITLFQNAKLQIGNNNLLPSAASLNLQQNAEFRTGGFSQELGSLRLTGSQASSTSTIILAAGVNHTLRFANTRNETWNTSRVLNITNWTGTSGGASANSGKVFFTPQDGSTPGVTEQQLSQIKLGNFCQGAELLPTGEIVPSFKPFISTVRGDNIGGPGNNTPLNWAGYVGSVITITGCNFDGPNLEVLLGNKKIFPIFLNAAKDTITFVLGHSDAGKVTVRTDNGSKVGIANLNNLGYVTKNSGLWNTPALWKGDNVPLANQKVLIAHPNVEVSAIVNDLNPVLPATHALTINPSSSLYLTGNHFLPAATPLILSGGTLRVYGGTTDAPPATPGFNQNFGTLTVTADSRISLDTFSSEIRFEPSQLAAWAAGANLEIANWKGVLAPVTTGSRAKIYVGTDNKGLTEEQLRRIRFLPLCFGASLMADGELVPSFSPFISSVTSSLSNQTFSYGAYISTKVTIEGCQINKVDSIRVGGKNIENFTLVNFDTTSDLFGWRVEFTCTKDMPDGLLEFISSDTVGFSPFPLVNLGFISKDNGLWNNNLTWLGNEVPNLDNSYPPKRVTIQNEVLINVPKDTLAGLEVNAAGLLTFMDGNELLVNGNIINAGTIQPAPGSVLRIGPNATLTNNGIFSSSDLGKVEFMGNGIINGTSPITFHDLVMNADTLQFPLLSAIPNSTAAHPIVSGEFRINGGVLRNQSTSFIGPRYGPNSKLIYASGGNRRRGAEWRGRTGTLEPGYPNEVWVTNGTIFSTNGPRPNSATNDNTIPISVAGNLFLSNGTVKNDLDRPLEVRGNLIIGESDSAKGHFFMGDPVFLPNHRLNYMIIGGNLSIYKNSTFDLQANRRYLRFEGLKDGAIIQPGHSGTPPTLQFYNVLIDKNGILTLHCPVRVFDHLQLSKGYVSTTAENILEIGLDGYWTEASDLSFVNGPLKKVTGQSLINLTPEYPDFEFPIGKIFSDVNGEIYLYKPVKMSNLIFNGQTVYSAEYFVGPTVNNPPVFYNNDLLDGILLGIWADQYWKVSRLSGLGKGRVTLPYEAGYSWFPFGPSPEGLVGVAQYNSLAESWEFTESEGDFGNPGARFRMVLHPGSNDSVYSSLLGAFNSDYFTIGWGLESILPLQLLYFTGHLQGNDVLLKWKVADHTDLRHFVVEHSTDGRVFSELGKVVWEENKEFGWRHIGPEPGVHYYRLQMVEKSGTRSFSRVEMVQVGVNQTLINGLVQNPVSGGMAILDIYSAKAQTAEASVFDISGRLVFRQQFSLSQGKNNSKLSILPLPPGQYRMLVRTLDGVQRVLPVMK